MKEEETAAPQASVLPMPPTHKPIQKRHDWPILIVGSFMLTVHSGFLNAITVLLLQTPVAHMSGHFTALGISLEELRLLDFAYIFGVLFCFCAGCCLSGVVLGVSKLSPLRPYGSLLLMMCATECLSMLLLMKDHHSMYAVFPLAFSCGIQNSLCTQWSGAVIRTTHFTGVITDLGLVIGHWIRFKLGLHEEGDPPVDAWKLVLFLPLLLGFSLGAIFGAATYRRFDYFAILFPGVFIGLCGLTYRLFRLKSEYFDFYRDLELTKWLPGRSSTPHEMTPLVSPIRALEA